MITPLLLARLQFAWTVGFHIVFPSMSIGLALFLVIVEALWLRTRDALYLRIYRFWSTIFAMGFGMGVVSGIVLSFEFGLGFSGFAQKAGPILGPVIGYEVLTAFFLEAGFLGIMLFGWHRVGPTLHFLATALVSLGTLFSASWILSVNSWMQHPVGFRVDAAGRFVPVNWLTIIVNPEWPYRLVHMLMAAWIATALFVAGVSAFYLLRRQHPEFARRSLDIATWAVTILIPLQMFLGDTLADDVVAKYQPAKVEAFEGYWDTPKAPASWLYFIIPDQARQRNVVQLGIPVLGSVLVRHDIKQTVPGLKNTPPSQQPNMGIVFYGFRIMFVIALVILVLALCTVWLRLRGRLYETGWYHRWLVAMIPAGYVAILAGWTTAEVGRQPYVVYGVLRTADAVSPMPVGAFLASFAVFVAVYLTLFVAFCVLLVRVVRAGPADTPRITNPSGTIRRALIPHGTMPAGAAVSHVGAHPSEVGAVSHPRGQA